MKARGKNAACAALNVLLAFVLVVGLAPGASHAAEGSGSRASNEVFDEAVVDDLAAEDTDVPSEVLPMNENAGQPASTDGGTALSDVPVNEAAEEDAEESDIDAPKVKKAAPAIRLLSAGEGEGPELVSFTVTPESSATSEDIAGTTYYAGKVTVEAKVKASELKEESSLAIAPAIGDSITGQFEKDNVEGEQEQTYSAKVVVSADGRYTATLKAMDGSGKPVQKRDSLEGGPVYDDDHHTYKRTFGIDATKPAVNIEKLECAEGATYDEGSKLYSGPVVATVTVIDANIDTPSGITLAVSERYSIQNSESITWDQDANDDSVHTAKITVEFSGSGDTAPCTLTVNAKDKLQNQASKATCDFTIDANPPKVSVELKSDKTAQTISGVNVYPGAVSAVVTAEDDGFSAEGSTVEVKKRGESSAQFTYPSDDSEVSWVKGDDGKHTLTVPAIEADGEYEITVTAKDAFGHEATETKSFDIDTTAPVVDIALAAADSSEVKTAYGIDYYTGAVNATITVADKHFDASKMKLEVLDKVKTVEATPAAIDTATWTDVGEDAHTLAVKLTGDGPCTVSVSGSDAVGSAMTEASAESLRFDTAVPTAAITKKTEDNVGGKVVRATVEVVVDEANFDKSEFTVSVQRTHDKDGGAVTEDAHKVSVDWVSQNDGRYAATVLFGEGSDFDAGTYSLTVSGADPVDRALTAGVEGQTLLKDIKIEQYEPTLRTEIKGAVAANKDGKVYYSASTLPTIVFKVIASTEDKLSGISLEDGWGNSAAPSWSKPDSSDYYQYDYDLRSRADVQSIAEGERTVKLTSSDATNPLYGIDVQGNAWEYKFTYDRTAPVKEASTYSEEGGTGENGFPKYVTGNNPKLTVNVKEANFDGDDFAVQAEPATDYASVAHGSAEVAGNWASSGDSHTRDVSFAGDDKFIISASGKDKAGNELSAVPETVYVDTADPVLDVQFEDEKVSGSSTNQYTSRTATVSITEANFDPALIKVNGTATAAGDWNLSTVTGKNVWTYSKDLKYDQDGSSYQLTVEGTDALGRPLVASPSLTPQSSDGPVKDGKYDSGTFIIDTKAPVLKVDSPKLVESGDEYYANSAVEFKIHVTDVNFVAPTVSVGGEALTPVEWAAGIDEHERVATVVIGGLNPSPAGLAGEKKYKLTIVGKDAAERALTVADGDSGTSQWFNNDTSTYECDFTLDETAPELTNVSVTSASAAGGDGDVKYYGGNVEVKLTVVEANFGPESAVVKVNGERKSPTWTDGVNANEHVGTITLAEDALYEVTFSCEDRAGNKLAEKPVEGAKFDGVTSTYTLDKFGIDARAPQLDVQVPQQASGGYYKDIPTFTVTVTEVNFDPTRIKVNGQATVASQWTSDGSTHVLQQTFNEQAAKQQLAVEGTDAAGRKLEGSGAVDGSYRSSEFIVDVTAPTLSVSFSGIENGMYAQGAVTATIAVVEQNFDPSLILVDGRALAAGSWSDSGNTHTATVAYSDDGSHVLTVSGTDAATHQLVGDGSTTVTNGTYTSAEMIVDNIDPQLTVNMTTPTNGKYYNTDVTIVATIEEANFSENSIQVSAEGSKSQSWENTGTTHKLTVVYSDESQSLSFGISGVDLSGRQLASGDDGATEVVDGAYRSIDFVIDKTSPVVKIALSQPVAVSAYKGSDYFRQALTLSALVTVDDANFDVSADTAHRANDVILLSGKPMSAYSPSGWGSGKAYSQTFGPNDDLANPSDLMVTVYDLAGNMVTYAYGDADESKGSTVDSAGKALSGSSFLLDVVAPRIEPGSGADIPSRKPSNDYEGTYKGQVLFFSSATTMSIKVVDDLGVSSVKQIGDDTTYSIAVDGQAGDTSRTVTVKLENGKEFTKNFVLYVVDTAGNWREWEINPKEGTVDDVSGSSTTNTALYGDKDSLYPTKAILDSVNPKVAFDNRVKAGSYYNTTQTERLVVNELNFRYLVSYNGSTPVLTITKQAGNASRAQSSNVIKANKLKAENASSGSYHYDMEFADDGHYSLEASFSDPAGNKSNIAEIKEFTIDKTAPRVEVTWDNNNVTNGRYYAASRTATVVVTEHNFSSGLIDVSTNGTVGGWTTDGDVHTAIVSFNSDGTYDLSITGRDLAGNELPAYTADQFVVDTSAPTVSISFAGADEGQRAFNGLVQPVITFADEANYDSAGASFTLRGNKTGDVQYDFSRINSDGGETVTYADFAHTIDVDDIYTLTATLTDMAGNQATEATETFSVNRFGSNFIVESPASKDGNTSDLGYLSEAPDITIREINVSGIEESSVAVTYNLKTTSLDRKSMSGEAGYVVQNLGDRSSYGWQEYDYIISKESFTGEAGSESPDGNYVVVLSSKDSTGNTNSSANFWVSKNDERKSADAGEEETDTEKRMSAAVKFTLDTTPPEVVGLSVENNQVIDAAGGHEVSFIATDTIGFDERNGVLVKVNGNQADYDIDGSGKVTFTVPEQRGVFQPIEITVSDYANNKFEQGVSEDGQEPFMIKVSSDFFDLHMPYIVGGGAAAVIVVAAVGIFFVRPRMAARAAAKATETTEK